MGVGGLVRGVVERRSLLLIRMTIRMMMTRRMWGCGRGTCAVATLAMCWTLCGSTSVLGISDRCMRRGSCGLAPTRRAQGCREISSGFRSRRRWQGVLCYPRCFGRGVGTSLGLRLSVSLHELCNGPRGVFLRGAPPAAVEAYGVGGL